jgi:hypothetical protein
MRRRFLSNLLIVLFSLQSFLVINAQVSKTPEFPKVFISPMTESFDSFITAALIKRKVPVSIVTNEELAEYIIVGNSVAGQHKWYDTVFGNDKDRVQGTLQLIRVSDKSIIWAGSAGDKTYWFREWRKGGQIKVAQRLADAMRKEYFDKQPKR